MTGSGPSSKKATTIGFTLGAILVLAIAVSFLKPWRSAESSQQSTSSVAATAAPRNPGPEAAAAPASMPVQNPHSFPAERTETPGPPLLAGTLSLDPSISLDANATLTVFVIARDGTEKGRTVLARRMDLQKFPAPFSLSSANLMAAGENLADVSLEARVDMDGDAMTREPGTPVARLSKVAIGNTNIRMTLRPE